MVWLEAFSITWRSDLLLGPDFSSRKLVPELSEFEPWTCKMYRFGEAKFGHTGEMFDRCAPLPPFHGQRCTRHIPWRFFYFYLFFRVLFLLHSSQKGQNVSARTLYVRPLDQYPLGVIAKLNIRYTEAS